MPVAVSPSSRRAWIEIFHRKLRNGIDIVALLAEGVDRNENEKENIYDGVSSPSSRRAWIEMSWISCIRCGR